MKMCEIYVGFEKNLQDYEKAYNEAEGKINECLAKAADAEAEMKKWQAEAERIEAENKEIIINVMALREAMMALQKGNFAPTEEERNEEKREQAQKEALAKAKEFKPAKSWTRRKGEIGQFKSNGEIMNSWSSQRSAAISLGWDTSSVSRFMKLDQKTQVRKKGFYLEYMGR